jgi:predicted metal-dependent hydrolase
VPISINKIIRTNRKTIALIVQKDGSLVIRAPLHMPELFINDFINKHTEWINKTQKNILSSQEQRKKYINGETFFFLGKEYPLKIVSNQKAPLSFNGEIFYLSHSALPKAEIVFIYWYKKQARKIISDLVDELAQSFGFSYQKIRISSARTRWGSCSSKNTLSFTYRLIMTPPEVVKYVVIHELVHTRVKNHSKSFWTSVERILPDYKKDKNWLKKNGNRLT